jgi:hypothetical protein
MRSPRCAFAAALAVLLVIAAQPPVSTQTGSTPTVAQFLSGASPIEVVAARNVDRIAWIAYDEGKRNVYTAAAPGFVPVRLTAYLKDDGIDLTAVRICADGSTVVFVRGSARTVQTRPSGPLARRTLASPGVWSKAATRNCRPTDAGCWWPGMARSIAQR